jgi:hypothetical protein
VKTELTYNSRCFILVKVGDKYEKRQVFIEKDEYADDIYHLYWYLEKDNLYTKRYLKRSKDVLRADFVFPKPQIGAATGAAKTNVEINGRIS